MERTDELKERIRQQPLNDRLEESRRRIGEMCSQGRCPKMTIPVQHDDDDFYINTTLADAQATIAALQAQLTALRELVGQWAWNTTNLLGDYRIATVADFNAEWTRRSIWLIEAVQATLPPPQAAQDKQTMYELRQQVEALQRERDQWREAFERSCDDTAHLKAALTATSQPQYGKDDRALTRRINDLEQALEFAVRGLKAAQPIVCSMCCPSVKRTSEPWTHRQSCDSLTLTLRTVEAQLS